MDARIKQSCCAVGVLQSIKIMLDISDLHKGLVTSQTHTRNIYECVRHHFLIPYSVHVCSGLWLLLKAKSSKLLLCVCWHVPLVVILELVAMVVISGNVL